GQVARSPELTGAVGLLAAVLLLGAWGGDLAAALVAAVRAPMLGPVAVAADPAEVVAWLRRAMLGVAVPLGGIVVGAMLAALAAHQAQVRGLWSPGLLAPDPSRFWPWRVGDDLAVRFGRGAWALAKAAVVLSVATWVMRARWPP